MRWDKTRGCSITLCKKLCKGLPPPWCSPPNPYSLTLPQYDYNDDAAEGFYQEAEYNFNTWSSLSSVISNHRRGVMLWFSSWLISIQSCTAFHSQYSVSQTLFLLIYLYYLTYTFSYWTIRLLLTHFPWLINTYINHSYTAVLFKLDLGNHT